MTTLAQMMSSMDMYCDVMLALMGRILPVAVICREGVDNEYVEAKESVHALFDRLAGIAEAEEPVAIAFASEADVMVLDKSMRHIDPQVRAEILKQPYGELRDQGWAHRCDRTRLITAQNSRMAMFSRQPFQMLDKDRVHLGRMCVFEYEPHRIPTHGNLPRFWRHAPVVRVVQ